MQMKFSIQQFTGDTKLYFKTPVNWLVIHGTGRLVINHSIHNFSERDFLQLPLNEQFSLLAISPVTIGVIETFDIVSTRTDFRIISGNETDLIQKTFWLALSAESADIPNKAKTMSAVSQLMWEIHIGASIKSRSVNVFVQEVLQQINDHYLDSDFDLNGIIAATGYSLGHFRKMFKEETGMPPLEHLNLQRLEHAKKIMWQEAEKAVIKDVAERSGFADANNFTKFFKRTMGITPKQYIEQIPKEKK